MDGLIERFNQTIRTMIRKAVEDQPSCWDACLDALLFAVQETPQASIGMAPFELLYRRRPRGLMEVLWNDWPPCQPQPPKP